VIIMDIQMPNMNGLEASRQIRQQDKWKHIPIIALSASATTKDIKEGLAIGMNAYLLKPLIPEDLFSALSRYCSSNHNVTAQSVVNDLPPLQDSSKLVGLNVAAGLKTCNGKQVLFEKMLRKFVLKYQHIDEELCQALDNGEITQAKALAHNLKGVSANIGAFQFSEIIGEIEEQLSDSSVNITNLPIAVLSERLQQVIISIEAYCRELS